MNTYLRYIVMDHRIIAFYRWEVEAQGSGRRDDDAVEWDPLRPLHPLVVAAAAVTLKTL